MARSLTHAQLVAQAVAWLRQSYSCGVILSEQYCATGEVPDAIGWKGVCHSVVIECKASRQDLLADTTKPFRRNADLALGCERFYLAMPGLIARDELPAHWGLLECRRASVRMVVKPGGKDLRSPLALRKEMNLLLASLRRVELRIAPQTITDFLKWKNRLAEYNGGQLPSGLSEEQNCHLSLDDLSF